MLSPLPIHSYATARIRFAIGECSLGSLLVAQSKDGVCAIALGDDPDSLSHELQARFSDAEQINDDAELEQQIATMARWVETPQHCHELPALDIRGTAFQQQVWRVIQDIPAGQTLSYTQVAEKMGAPKSVRAVAGACAANVLALAIPCHRVIRQDGHLGGYRWGINRKQALLSREASLHGNCPASPY